LISGALVVQLLKWQLVDILGIRMKMYAFSSSYISMTLFCLLGSAISLFVVEITAFYAFFILIVEQQSSSLILGFAGACVI
jgi:hypothetical protein